MMITSAPAPTPPSDIKVLKLYPNTTSYSAGFILSLGYQKIITFMRHRIKSGKIGSFNPEKMKVETEEFESDEISEDIEEIIEEVTELRGNDATIEALEFYYPADNNEPE